MPAGRDRGSGGSNTVLIARWEIGKGKCTGYNMDNTFQVRISSNGQKRSHSPITYGASASVAPICTQKESVPHSPAVSEGKPASVASALSTASVRGTFTSPLAWASARMRATNWEMACKIGGRTWGRGSVWGLRLDYYCDVETAKGVGRRVAKRENVWRFFAPHD